MNKLPRSCSRINPSSSPIFRGTPAQREIRWEFATHFRDRLEIIYGEANPGYLLRMIRRSRNYRELIRRYSNDSML